MKTVSKETKQYIKKLKEQLHEKGILENIDDLALTLIENTHHQYITATKYLIENGYTYPLTTREGIIQKSYPEVKIALDAQKELLKLLQNFGCTSGSRKNVKDSLTTKEENSPLAEFLGTEKR